MSETTVHKKDKQTHQPARCLARLLEDLTNDEQEIQEHIENMPTTSTADDDHTQLPTESDLFAENANIKRSCQSAFTSSHPHHRHKPTSSAMIT